MRIGIVTEIKEGEVRVALNPTGVSALAASGHEVLIQAGAGAGVRFPDPRYMDAGARIIDEAADVWARADLLLKVKEPQPSEYGHFRRDLTLFAYLHVENNRPLGRELIDKQMTAIAFEHVEDDDGYQPILEPMLEIAGFMGMLFAFTHAASTAGGRGKMPGEVAGIAPSRVRILGANPMAFQAARAAYSLGADVILLDPDVRRLQRARATVPGLQTLVSHPHVLSQAVQEADIVVNTYPFKPGAGEPLITREHVRSMRERALLVDLASDALGAVETSRETSFAAPTYEEEGIVHLCIPNMPSGAARSSAHALTNSLLPFLERILDLGARGALRIDTSLRRGLVTIDGQVTHAPTAEVLAVNAVSPGMVLGLAGRHSFEEDPSL